MAKSPVKKLKDNENKHWKNLAEGQKSFAVQLLHYFHYRPRLTLKSWTREEVLIWELWHALEILPRNIFLKRILDACVSTNGIVMIHVTVEPYPNLGLGGNKRNSRSDIEFCLNGKPWIWLEAKTTPVSLKKLSRQLAIQRSAPTHPTFVIPLVPDTQLLDSEIALRWNTIKTILQQTIDELTSNPAGELLEGQINVATELYKRITTHEPKLIS